MLINIKCCFLILQLLAHEIGHNLGMLHDFDTRHKGKGCVKDNHIMNYGKSKEVWSECSKKDFQANYLRTTKSSKWCMEGSKYLLKISNY